MKFDLGLEIVERFYNKDIAEKAKKDFMDVFQKKQNPDDIKLMELKKMPLPNY